MKKFESSLEQGAMLNVPVYESHRRGRNWMAIIRKDPKAPGGLARLFMEPAHGNYFYFVDGIKVGAPVEFGADYYTGGGSRSATRWYGVVVELDDEKIVIEQYSSAEEAIEASKKYVGIEAKIQELEKEKKRLEEKLKEIESSLAALKKELKEE